MKSLLLPIILFALIFFPRSITANAAVPGWTPPENYRESDSIGMLSESPEDDQKTEMSQEEKDINDGELPLQGLNSIVTLNVDRCDTTIFGG